MPIDDQGYVDLTTRASSNMVSGAPPYGDIVEATLERLRRERERVRALRSRSRSRGRSPAGRRRSLSLGPRGGRRRSLPPAVKQSRSRSRSRGPRTSPRKKRGDRLARRRAGPRALGHGRRWRRRTLGDVLMCPCC